MPSSQAPAYLQVLPTEQFLGEPVHLQAPAMLTQVTSAAVAEALVTCLQKQFPANHPVSLLVATRTAEPLTCHTCLEEVPQQSVEYPYDLYLPVLASPATMAVQALVDVVARLRSPDGGCPWDLAQTPTSLTPYVIEEAYEVVDAIRQGEPAAIAEELGDLLLQVVLQAQIAGEAPTFTLQDVAEGITEKLIRRHPHVFGDLEISSIDEVRANWEDIKATEKQTEAAPERLSQKLQRYARSLPPVMAGLKISEKAAASGLEWPDINGIWEKFYEELAEFQEALLQNDPDHQRAELGDLMFSVINLARWCELDPAEALRETNLRFVDRLGQVEVLAEKPLTDYTLEELEALWQQAKQQLQQAQAPAEELSATSVEGSDEAASPETKLLVNE